MCVCPNWTGRSGRASIIIIFSSFQAAKVHRAGQLKFHNNLESSNEAIDFKNFLHPLCWVWLHGLFSWPNQGLPFNSWFDWMILTLKILFLSHSTHTYSHTCLMWGNWRDQIKSWTLWADPSCWKWNNMCPPVPWHSLKSSPPFLLSLMWTNWHRGHETRSIILPLSTKLAARLLLTFFRLGFAMIGLYLLFLMS